jgi:anti-anti-sigma factor
MNFTESQKGEITLLKVNGKLDSDLSPKLEKKVCEFLQSGHTKLLLDMGEVNYISSAGLRMLISIKKQVKTLSGIFIVCGLRSEVLEVMKICGFDHILEIAPTEEEALRRF